MSTQNSLQTAQENGVRNIGAFLSGINVQKSLANALGDTKEIQKFVSSIISATSTNPALQACEYATVVSSALLANALRLSLSPQLGYSYLVPYNVKDKEKSKELGRDVYRDVATFILGYRGYLQLAMRSGQYLDIDCIEIREGEYLGRDEETGQHRFKFIQDDDIRLTKKIIGYKASFILINGFKKTLYWSKSKMMNHADTYSPAFKLNGVKSADTRKSKVSFADYEAGKFPESDAWKYSSFWYKDFDGMAFKTMIRQLISKWGIMSIDLEKAFENDGGFMAEDNTFVRTENYSDTESIIEQVGDIEVQKKRETDTSITQTSEDSSLTKPKGRKKESENVKQKEFLEETFFNQD